jgi:tellurite resistance protein
MSGPRFLLGAILLVGGLAEARVGGGQHYSGSSHASGSHSAPHSTSGSHTSFGPSHSSGGGYVGGGYGYNRTGLAPTATRIDPLLMLAFVLLAIVLYVLLRRIFGASAVTQRALREQDEVVTASIAPAERQAWVAALQQRDPAFNLDAFTGRITALFLATQGAWSSGDMLPVRRFLSDATWLRLRLQLALLRAQGVRNLTTEVAVTDMQLVGFEQNAWFDTLHVAIQAEARDADVPVQWSEEKAQAVAARAQSQGFSEVWSLVRKPAVQSKGTDALAALNCPSCGAPFEGGASSTCPYCKAVVNSGAYDWVLAEITQASEASPANVAVPGLDALRERDPGLSLEVLEDRASLIFWRWVEAQSTGQPERLARLAENSPVERMRTDVERLAERGMRRVFRQCAVGAVRVRAFEAVEARSLAHVEIRWSARMGVGPLGQPPPALPTLPQRWVFTLARDANAASRTDEGMSTDRCAHCGGPLGDGLVASCPWCQAVLSNDLRDWVLAEATPFEAWQGRHAEGASQVSDTTPLPDLEERERMLYTLAAMAMADGQVDARERRLLLQCAQRWGLPAEHVESALAAGPSALETLLPSPRAGEPFLRALAELAGIDGRVDATERRMLESVASRLGLSQRLPALLAALS